MKAIFLLLGLTMAVGLAKPPTQPALSRYGKLYQNSPFTTKPEGPAGPVVRNPFEDWSLGGISKLADGWYGVLISKKDPSKREVVGRGELKTFQIVDVRRKGEGWRSTVVDLRSGSRTGTVEFDEKLITVKAAPAAPPNQPQVPPQVRQAARNRAAASGNTSGGRTRRPRVVVPPSSNNSQNNRPTRGR